MHYIKPVRTVDLPGFFSVAAGAFVLGGGLIVSSAYGAKWFVMVFFGYMIFSVLCFFKDVRLFGFWLFSGSVPVGIQYRLWTHGDKHVILTHFGGAPPEPVINLVDFSIFYLIIVGFFDFVFSKRKLPEWTTFDSFLLAFLFFSTLSLINTNEYLLFTFEVLRYLKYYLLYWALRMYIGEPLFIWGMFAISFLVLGLQGLVSMLQYFLYFTLPLPVGGVSGTQFMTMAGEDIQRVTGFLGHANTFAAYLIIPLSSAVILFFSKISWWYKTAIVPFFVLGVMALILTFSRNGWLTFAICFAIVLCVAMAKKRLSKTLCIFTCSFLIFLTGIIYGLGLDSTITHSVLSSRSNSSPGLIKTVYIRIFEDDGRAFDSRWDLLAMAFEMVKEHPFIGIGLNSFEENMTLYDTTGITNIIKQPVHNTYMLFAAETGVISAVLFFVMGFVLIAYSYPLVKSSEEIHYIVGTLGLCSFIGLGFANLFDVSIRKEPIMGLAVMLSVLVVDVNLKYKKRYDLKM